MVRRYVHVTAASRWRVFLHSWYDAGLCYYLFVVALAKTVTPGGSAPPVAGLARATYYKSVALATILSRHARQLHIPTCWR